MLVNLTPHTLNIYDADGNLALVLPASGQVARVTTERHISHFEDGDIPVYVTRYGDITGLPEPQADTMYVVSALVKVAADRADVVSPGELIRNDAGQPMGCRGLDM